MSIPISQGSGAASVAAEAVSGLQYQQIEVLGKGGSSTLGVNPDGSLNASIIGTPNVNVSGSVFATLSGAGSIIAVPVGSVVTVWQNSSILAVPVGSVITTNIGSVITVWKDSSVIAVPTGSVITVGQGSIAVAIVSGSILTSSTANQSVSGTVGASVIGWVPIQASNTSVITIWQNSSILSVPVGSTIAVLQSSSILAVPVGSTIGVWQSPSIVGTYAEDAAHTTADKGIFTLGVRNDTMTTATSADSEYSANALGPVGEAITANAPITKWVRGTADLRVVLGASVTAIPAQGASIFTYITGIQLANMGSASVLVTFTGGLGSILGYSIAPAGGGSNIYYPNALKTGENSAFAASISGTASVLVSAQGFISKT